MSSWVATQPPSAIGWFIMEMTRPSGNFVILLKVAP